MEILRYRAFTTAGNDPTSGNPAGVVMHAEGLTDAEMTGIAAELGYSETAFLTAITASTARVRFFTPLAEIGFCGHATIASGVALARAGAEPVVVLTTNVGDVPVEATPQQATLTAVDTTVESLDPGLLNELLGALRLEQASLDPELPPAMLRGGNPHPLVFVLGDVLTTLDHDPAAVLALQDREGWDGTVPVVHRVSTAHFASRNPFPRGGIYEDPATGSAAADLGAYLRAGNHVETPATVTVDQGSEVGRPSRLVVDIPAHGGIRVTGTADVID